MSTATGTNPPPNKRTRFSENDSTSTSEINNHKVQPPKILAESFIRSTTSSLHPLIAPDVEKLGKEHLLLLSKKNHLDKANKRLVDDKDHIPSSARIKFELSVSDRVKEMSEYKTLQENTIDVIQEAHLGLKTQIIAASKLEIKAIKITIAHHLIKSIRLITNAYLLILNDKTNVDEAVYIMAKHYIIALSIHIPMNLREFITIYKEVHTIDTFPPRLLLTNTNTQTTTTTTTTTTQPTTSPFFGNNSSGGTGTGGGNSTRGTPRQSQQEAKQEEKQEEQVVAVIIPPNITTIKNCIENVFVTSWSRFLEQQSKNELAIELKKLSTTFFTTRSSSETTAIVDAEPAADKKELKALIRLQTIEETKNLLKQLNDMKKEIHQLKTSSKNSKQGGKESASSKKIKSPSNVTKKSSSNNKKKQKKSSGPKKVGGNNKGTDDEKKNSKQKSGKKKSKTTGKNSNNKQQQSSRKSNTK